MCGAAVVQVHAAMDGDAGVETEMSCCTVLSGARVFLYCVHACRQQRLTTSRSKRQLAWRYLGGWHVFGNGVRTGGRLHPGLAGERLLKQRLIVGCLEDVGIAGFSEEAFCTVLCCALVFLYCNVTCRQPRLTLAARTELLGCLAFSKAKSSGRVHVYTHPGLAGERLPEQRPKPCSCFRRPRGYAALPRRRFWFLDRRLWVPSSHRGVCGPVANSARPWIPATTSPPPCSASVLVFSGASSVRSRREA